MKYIRTKNGISATDYHNDENGYFITTDYVDYKDSEVINQADTIEELCDEFVVCRSGQKPHTADVKWHIIKRDSNYINYIGYVIYGAIWCEFGLKYVARMNNEGELELL